MACAISSGPFCLTLGKFDRCPANTVLEGKPKNLRAWAGEGAAGEANGRSSPERREAAEQAAVEGRVREGVAALLFVEVLFWKTARESEAVRDQYNWQVKD